jgi:hypothetical protein
MNTVSVLMIGGTMAIIKYDIKNNLSFKDINK